MAATTPACSAVGFILAVVAVFAVTFSDAAVTFGVGDCGNGGDGDVLDVD